MKPPHGPHELYGHLRPPSKLFTGFEQRRREHEERKAREQWLADQRAKRQREVNEARTAIASATGLRKAMLEHHGPTKEPCNGEYYCEGCDGGDFFGDGTPWPCSSWDIAVSYREGE